MLLTKKAVPQGRLYYVLRFLSFPLADGGTQSKATYVIAHVGIQDDGLRKGVTLSIFQGLVAFVKLIQLIGQGFNGDSVLH